jgi:hypothetical protein
VGGKEVVGVTKIWVKNGHGIHVRKKTCINIQNLPIFLIAYKDLTWEMKVKQTYMGMKLLWCMHTSFGNKRLIHWLRARLWARRVCAMEHFKLFKGFPLFMFDV